MVFATVRRDPLARSLPRGDDGPVAGVECEYRLLDANDRPADARVHLTPLLADLPHLDPGDPRAVRLPLGSALTCDGWEAEAVTPPIPWGPAVARELTDCVAATRAELLTILSVGTPSAGVAAVEGFSTHLNVTVPDRRAMTIARDLAHRCSVAMALLSEGPAGDGLLIRPRRGRLEVGCDHLEDRMLGPAVVLLVGVVGLLQHRRSRLPRLDLTVRPAREKFGHYVARDAAGADVVTSGRAMVLRTRRGTRLSGQDHLEQVWSAARPYAEAHGLAVGGTDALVAGSTPLPCEANPPGRWTTAEPPSTDPGRRWGVDLSPRTRVAGTVTVGWATWATTAWRCVSADGTVRFAVVPRSQHAGFVAELDAGRLDHLLLARGSGGADAARGGADAGRWRRQRWLVS